VRAEVADAAVDVEPAVRLQHHDRVEAHRARAVRANGDADAAHLRALADAARHLPLVPAEGLFATIERVLHEGAGHVTALAVRQRRRIDGLALRRVDAADGHLVEAELLG